MLKITNGTRCLRVSKGAFRELYSPSGWVVVDNTPHIASQEPAVAPEEGSEGKHTANREELPEGPYNGSEEDIIQNMSEEELKQYASLLGIKIKGLTKGELLEAIQAYKE